MTLEKLAHETDVSKQVTSFRKSPVRSICVRGKERGEEEERELEIKGKQERGKGERKERS